MFQVEAVFKCSSTPARSAPTRKILMVRQRYRQVVGNRRKAVVKLLLKNGPAIVLENKGGWTALQLSALDRHEGVAGRLFIGFKSSFRRVMHSIFYFYDFNKEGLGRAEVHIFCT
jgi:hypothetical protein